MPRMDVNATCIARGGRNAWDDPIALAFRQAGFSGAVVTPASVKMGDRIIDLPDEACCFVADWDSGRSVRPFVWDVPPLDGPGWREIGVQRGAKA